MTNARYAGLALVIALCAVDARSDPPRAALEIVDGARKTAPLSVAELRKLPQTEIKARDHRGDEATYSGVLLATALGQADVPLGARLRGKALASYVVVEAADKYRVLFSLPEIDPASTDRVVLLAITRNGEPLDAAHGPLQLVVPGDKKHARWVKQVVRVTVRSDAPEQDSK